MCKSGYVVYFADPCNNDIYGCQAKSAAVLNAAIFNPISELHRVTSVGLDIPSDSSVAVCWWAAMFLSKAEQKNNHLCNWCQWAENQCFFL